jgi:hypothetical protein
MGRDPLPALSWLGNGPNPVAFFRRGWDIENAPWRVAADDTRSLTAVFSPDSNGSLEIISTLGKLGDSH